MAQHSVLVVDDDSTLRDSLCDSLSDMFSNMFSEAYSNQHCRILSADCGLRALSILQQEECGLIFSDVDMPDISGFELLARLQRQHVRTPYVLMSARADQHLEAEAQRAGALAMLHKPVQFGIVSHITQQIFSGA